jgi:hypothetical protein
MWVLSQDGNTMIDADVLKIESFQGFSTEKGNYEYVITAYRGKLSWYVGHFPTEFAAKNVLRDMFAGSTNSYEVK